MASRFTFSVNPDTGPETVVGVAVGRTGVAVLGRVVGLGVGVGLLQDAIIITATNIRTKGQAVRGLKMHLHDLIGSMPNQLGRKVESNRRAGLHFRYYHSPVWRNQSGRLGTGLASLKFASRYANNVSTS